MSIENFTKNTQGKEFNEFRSSEDHAKQLEEICKTKARAKSAALPLPLQRASRIPKQYPFDALGAILGPAARRIHEVVQAPDATCGQCVLAALSLACQAFIDVFIDGRVYPTSLFMLTVSESGERKSATDKIILKPIYDWQTMLGMQHKRLFKEYKNDHDYWKRKRAESIKDTNNANDLKMLDSEPLPPCEGLILCEEPTLEGLEQLLEKGQPSIGIFSDEGGRLIGGHAMNADNALKTACGFSNLWDGKPLTRVRKGDGNKIHYGRRAAMHLMLQPVVLAQLLNNQLLMGQGIFSRCLIAAPLPIAGTRKYKEVDLSQDPKIITAHVLLNKIIDRPYPKKDQNDQSKNFGPEDSLSPQQMYLSAEAKRIWIQYHDEVDRKMGEDGVYCPIKPFASKAPEQVLRISALLAFSEYVSASETSLQIDLKPINRAIELVEYYLDEAIRISEQSTNDEKMELAEKTLKWIQQEHPNQVFALSDVYQKGPTRVRNAEAAKQVMKILQDHYYVMNLPDAEVHGIKVKSAWKLIKA